MTATIRLATDDDLRAITSKDLSPIARLPRLYIPTEDQDIMRSWGVARSDGDASVFFYARQFPGALVAPHDFGQFASRGDLLYHGAEPASEFSQP